MATAIAELKEAPRYAHTRKLFWRTRSVVLPWESLAGSLWVGSAVGFLNGLQLLTPPSTYAASPEAFAILVRLIPEQMLGILLVAGSLLAGLALLEEWHWLQMRAGAALAGLYIYLSMGLLGTAPHGLGWVTFAGIGGCLAISVGAQLCRASRDGP